MTYDGMQNINGLLSHTYIYRLWGITIYRETSEHIACTRLHTPCPAFASQPIKQIIFYDYVNIGAIIINSILKTKKLLYENYEQLLHFSCAHTVFQMGFRMQFLIASRWQSRNRERIARVTCDLSSSIIAFTLSAYWNLFIPFAFRLFQCNPRRFQLLTVRETVVIIKSSTNPEKINKNSFELRTFRVLIVEIVSFVSYVTAVVVVGFLISISFIYLKSLQ